MEDGSTTCPNCGAIVDIEMASVITPGSEELQDLYKGKLNLATCDTCESMFTAEMPLVYRNSDKHSLIYYLPPSLCEDEIQATQAVDTLREELQDELADKVLPTCRLVMAYSQFIEKIALLEAGLDDRVVEYAKYILLQNAPDISHDAFELLYDFTAENADALTFIAYDRDSHQAEYSMEFDKADFKELTDFFAESPEAEGKLEELFPDYTVNVGLLLDYAAEAE